MGTGPLLIIIGLVIVAVSFALGAMNFKKNFFSDRINMQAGFGNHLGMMVIMMGGGIVSLIGIVLTVVHFMGG